MDLDALVFGSDRGFRFDHWIAAIFETGGSCGKQNKDGQKHLSDHGRGAGMLYVDWLHSISCMDIASVFGGRSVHVGLLVYQLSIFVVSSFGFLCAFDFGCADCLWSLFDDAVIKKKPPQNRGGSRRF
jgi:hypothetical protein